MGKFMSDTDKSGDKSLNNQFEELSKKINKIENFLVDKKSEVGAENIELPVKNLKNILDDIRNKSEIDFDTLKSSNDQLASITKNIIDDLNTKNKNQTDKNEIYETYITKLLNDVSAIKSDIS